MAWLLVVGAAAHAARGQQDGQLLAPPERRAPGSSLAPAAADQPPSLLGASPIRPPGAAAAVSPSPSAPFAPRDLTPVASATSRAGLKISKGAGVLPNDHGQVWREYDLSPYTLQVRDVARPEQAIVDWILRETGTEVWFSEPLGVLNATGTTLRVYHTPPMHDRVRGIVERFVGGQAEAQSLAVRLLTIGSPNWRSRALPLLRPVEVKSPGVEAWLLSRENAALLYAQLKDRGDFREHSSPNVAIPNGQSHTLARTQARSYAKSVQLQREYPFYAVLSGQIDEGYSLEISPLLSLDGQTIEAAVDCRVDQIEKLVPLALDVPIGTSTQRVQIQVPQVASWRLTERFRWPASDVLLLSCGVVANPAPGAAGPLSLLAPLGVASSRADALLLIEHRPASVSGIAAAPTAAAPAVAVPLVTPPSSAPAGPPNTISRGRY